MQTSPHPIRENIPAPAKLVTGTSGTKLRDPEGVRQESPGREPWEKGDNVDRALKGRHRLHRPCRAPLSLPLFPQGSRLGLSCLALARLSNTRCRSKLHTRKTPYPSAIRDRHLFHPSRFPGRTTVPIPISCPLTDRISADARIFGKLLPAFVFGQRQSRGYRQHPIVY